MRWTIKTLLLVWVVTGVGCDKSECETPNPNYDQQDPTSVACLDGEPGTSNGSDTEGLNSAQTVSPFDAGSTPPDGLWKGDFIDLVMEDGLIRSITVHGVACSMSDPDNPFISLCSSDPVDGEFQYGIGITGDLNYFTNEPEWRVSGELASMKQIEGLFLPLDAPPADFRSIAGTFYLMAEGCDCAGKVNFNTYWVPPPEELATTGGPGLILDENGNVLSAKTEEVAIPEEISEPQLAALDHVNVFREMVGVPLINGNENLQAAAMDHCACYTEHKDEYGSMSPHSEDASWAPPCYGELGERIQEKNYTGGAGYSEVMAFMNDPINSVEAWMATVYHRLPLIDPGSKDMGYGHSAGCDTINVGMGGNGGSWEVIYPIDGQTDVDTQWSGNEGPQPKVPPGGYPSGPVITIQFGSASFSIAEAVIRDPSGASLPLTLLTPENDSFLGGDAISFYTNSPLSTQTEYGVEVRGIVNGTEWEKRWSFTTGNGDSNW